MNERLKIITPNIFLEERIISGITEKMDDIFPTYGFSVNPSKNVSEQQVLEYRQTLASFLEIEYENFIYQKQTHSDIIRLVNKNDIEDYSDGLITNEKGIILCIKVADCCAVLCYDPVTQSIGAFHSGWRGTQKKIVIKGLKMMVNYLDVDVANILIYLSPCASVSCYEVQEEFLSIFPETTIKEPDGRIMFDIKAEINSQLLSIGIKKENIEISPFCTISDNRFHSYRRDKERSGRMVAFIGMK